MDAVLMCGGTGSRLDTPTEKPLFEIAGTPMIQRVLTALTSSSIFSIYPVVTPAVPDTTTFLESQGYEPIQTRGNGYVPDLLDSLSHVTQPALTVATDLPLITAPVIDAILDAHTNGSLTVTVPLTLKRDLGLSAAMTITHEATEVVPTGVNIASTDDQESIIVRHDHRLAVNVNTLTDARVAEELL